MEKEIGKRYEDFSTQQKLQALKNKALVTGQQLARTENIRDKIDKIIEQQYLENLIQSEDYQQRDQEVIQ